VTTPQLGLISLVLMVVEFLADLNHDHVMAFE
jgi:hypothetical protein